MKSFSRPGFRASLFLLAAVVTPGAGWMASGRLGAEEPLPYIAPPAPHDAPRIAAAPEGAPKEAAPPSQGAPVPADPAQEPPATDTATASLGTATADFENVRPDKNETPWGRLVADALLVAGKADVILRRQPKDPQVRRQRALSGG